MHSSERMPSVFCPVIGHPFGLKAGTREHARECSSTCSCSTIFQANWLQEALYYTEHVILQWWHAIKGVRDSFPSLELIGLPCVLILIPLRHSQAKHDLSLKLLLLWPTQNRRRPGEKAKPTSLAKRKRTPRLHLMWIHKNGLLNGVFCPSIEVQRFT